MGASLSLSVAESNVSQANNTSVVKATVKITTTGETRNEYSPSGYVIIDGTKYTFSHSFGRNTTTVLTTKSKTVTHNNDGSKTVTVKVSFNTGVSAGTLSKTVTKVLTKITRQYTVAYNANGGSGAPGTQTKVYGTTLKLSSTKPTRSGYTFQGWATSSGGSVAYVAGANYTANAAVTLYAVWQANTYAVNYNANGGSGAPSAQTKTHGIALTLSSTRPTRNGYSFVGWATSAGSTSPSYQPSATYTNNAPVNLYAVWTSEYKEPSVGNINIYRCNSSGDARGSGEYVCMSFVWTAGIDPTLSTYATTVKVEYESTVWYAETTFTSKDGTVSLGPTQLDSKKDFYATITLTDTQANETTVQTVLIPQIGLPVDISPNEDNITLFGTCDDGKTGLIVNSNVECENITANNLYADNVGVYYHSRGNYSIPTANTFSIGAHITVPAGVYILMAYWTFNGENRGAVTHTMQVSIGTGNSPNNVGNLQHQRIHSATDAYARLTVAYAVITTSEKSFYVNGWDGQINHPTAGLCGIQAVRIR